MSLGFVTIYQNPRTKTFAKQPVCACADETKLWLSPSAKQLRNSCSGLPPVHHDLSTRHDWPVKKAIVRLPISMKGNSKRTSGNSSSVSWGPKTWMVGSKTSLASKSCFV